MMDVVSQVARPHRMNGYRIVRPATTYTPGGVCQWLRHHPDGGWLQAGDLPRWEAAWLLLFVLWLVAAGRLSDDR